MTPRLLTIAALTPTKDPITLVRALALLRDLSWTAHWVGSDEVDRDYTARVRTELETTGLGSRLLLRGIRIGPALEAEWAAADVLVLPSRAETYGLVVSEALAHGVPAVVTAETGAVEALDAGSRPPVDAAAPSQAGHSGPRRRSRRAGRGAAQLVDRPGPATPLAGRRRRSTR